MHATSEAINSIIHLMKVLKHSYTLATRRAHRVIPCGLLRSSPTRRSRWACRATRSPNASLTRARPSRRQGCSCCQGWVSAPVCCFDLLNSSFHLIKSLYKRVMNFCDSENTIHFRWSHVQEPIFCHSAQNIHTIVPYPSWSAYQRLGVVFVFKTAMIAQKPSPDSFTLLFNAGTAGNKSIIVKL